MIRIPLLRPTLVGLLSLALLAACGGEDPAQDDNNEPQRECGDDTVLEDGACVPELSEGCSEGRVLTPAGRCLEPDIFCGDNTVYDVDTEECVSPNEIRCGEGTIEVNGRCEVENPITCGDGTVLADDECLLSEEVCGDGTEFEDLHCQPSDQACQAGAQWDAAAGECTHGGSPDCGDQTIEVDGQCLPQVTVADELAAEADIDYSDDSPIVVGAAGDFVFTGTMDNGQPHTFDLQGTEGQWLKIEIYSRGLPAPGLEISGPDNWQRNSVPGMANPATRTVLLPASETFELTVTSLLSDSADVGSIADESWQYVGTAELVDAPTPLQWSPLSDTLSGDFQEPTVNFIEVDSAGGDDLVISPDTVGPDVENATVEIWSSPTTFEERFQLQQGQQFLLNTDSATYLHIDGTAFYGPYTEFEFSAEEPLSLQPGQFAEVEVFAEAGELLALEHTNTEAEALDVAIFFQGSLIAEPGSVRAANESSYSFSEHMRNWYYVETSGDYTVRYSNTGSSDAENVLTQSYTDAGNIVTLPEPGSAPAEFSVAYDETTRSGDWRLVVIDAPSAANVEWEQDSSSGSIYHSVYNSNYEELAAGFSNSLDYTIPEAGTYYFYTRASTNAEDVTIDIVAESLETLQPGETVEVDFMDVATFDLLIGNITHDSGSAPDVRLLNPNGQLVFEELEVAEQFRLLETFPGPGDYTLVIENNGDTPIIGLNIEAEAYETYDSFSVPGEFTEDYLLPAMAEGDRQFFLIRPQGDLIMSTGAVVGEQEEVAIRIWDATRRELIREVDGIEDVSTATSALEEGTFIVEVQALTDIAADFDFYVSGQSIIVANGERLHDPFILIEPTGDDSGTESSSINITGCPIVADVSVTTEFADGLASFVEIDLQAPGAANPVRLLDASGSLSTTYPDPSEPAESLDDLAGTAGNGEWTLVINNTASFTDAEFDGWELNLICTE